MKKILVLIRFIDNLNEWVGKMVSILIPALVLLLTFEAIVRYVFNAPTTWSYDIALFIFGYVGLLGGGYVHKRNQHITVDIIYERLSPRTKAVLDVFIGLFISVFLISMVVYGIEPAILSFQRHEVTMSEWGAPVAHYKMLVPRGSVFVSFTGIC